MYGCMNVKLACHYLSTLWGDLDVYWATIILLTAFAFLNLMGISGTLPALHAHQPIVLI
jgi:hypothetical protein